MGLNQILYLQICIARLFMERKKMPLAKFLELDKKYGILKFLEIGYEPFHLTGHEGIIDEVEDYIKMQELADTSKN